MGGGGVRPLVRARGMGGARVRHVRCVVCALVRCPRAAALSFAVVVVHVCVCSRAHAAGAYVVIS